MGALLYEFNEFGQMPKLESQGVVSDPEQDGDITGRLNGGLIRMGMGTPPAKPWVDTLIRPGH